MRFRTKSAIILLFSALIISIATVYSVNNKSKTPQYEISPQQISGQVYYFKEVLDQFGVKSVEIFS